MYYTVGANKTSPPRLYGGLPRFCTGYYPVQCNQPTLGSLDAFYPQLPRVVYSMHCTRNYPACRLVIGCHRFLASDWPCRYPGPVPESSILIMKETCTRKKGNVGNTQPCGLPTPLYKNAKYFHRPHFELN